MAERERDQKLRELEFRYQDKLAHLAQSHIHPSLWFIVEGAVAEHIGFHRLITLLEVMSGLHSCTSIDLRLHGCLCGRLAHCTLNNTVIEAVKSVWKTSQPEHIGPDPDCVPVLRFPGMNLERVDAERSAELNLPVGSILLSQMEYIIEVLMKFEPSLQLKTRTTPGNQESFATRPTTSISNRSRTFRIPCITTSSRARGDVELDALKKNTKLQQF